MSKSKPKAAEILRLPSVLNSYWTLLLQSAIARLFSPHASASANSHPTRARYGKLTI